MDLPIIFSYISWVEKDKRHFWKWYWYLSSGVEVDPHPHQTKVDSMLFMKFVTEVNAKCFLFLHIFLETLIYQVLHFELTGINLCSKEIYALSHR